MKTGELTKPAWGNRIMGMDGLRGIAAITVLMGHVSASLAVGVQHPGPLGTVVAVAGQGLTLFFALSGFLLYRGFAAAIISGRKLPRLGSYFANRALRIFPAYLVILLVVRLLVGLPSDQLTSPAVPVNPAPGYTSRLTDPLLWLMNATMLHTFTPWSIGTGLAVSWTLTVELVFYVVMPLVALGAFAVARHIPRVSTLLALAPAAVMLIVGICGKLLLESIFNPATEAESNYLLWGANWTSVLARSFLVHADLFAFGMIAAVIWSLFDARPAAVGREWFRWGGLVVAGVLLVALKESPVFADTAYAAFGGAAILFVTLCTRNRTPAAAARVLEWDPFLNVGKVSFSLYLWHLPVIWALQQTGLHFPVTASGYWLNVALVLAIGLILSAITYKAVEEQALKLKRRTDTSAVTPGPVRSYSRL